MFLKKIILTLEDEWRRRRKSLEAKSWDNFYISGRWEYSKNMKKTYYKYCNINKITKYKYGFITRVGINMTFKLYLLYYCPFVYNYSNGFLEFTFKKICTICKYHCLYICFVLCCYIDWSQNRFYPTLLIIYMFVLLNNM